MLAPPNGGSEMADALKRLHVLDGPPRSELGTGPDGVPSRLGRADFELGVIAGNRSVNPLSRWLFRGPNDGLVSVERAKLAGMTDFLVVPHTHTFLMRSADVIEQTLAFLHSGRFEPRRLR
jgi:hypothetical protein